MSDIGMVIAGLLAAASVWWWRPDAHPRLDRALDATPQPPRWRPTRAQAQTGVAAGLCGWLLGATVMAQLAWPLAVVSALAGAWFQPRFESRADRARRAAIAVDLPITCELLASSLDAGAPLRLAVEQVAQLGPTSTAAGLRMLDDAVKLGVHEPDAWGLLVDDPEWGVVARDMRRCAETGAPASEVLREHAAEKRRMVADARLSAARAVGVRSVLPLMTCFLPAFLLVGVVPIIASLLPRLLGH